MQNAVMPRPAIEPDAGQTLDVEGVSHRFGAVTALADVSLDVRGGELVALLGPSGCGKTTLLRAIGGFLVQSSGQIRIGGATDFAIAGPLHRDSAIYRQFRWFRQANGNLYNLAGG